MRILVICLILTCSTSYGISVRQICSLAFSYLRKDAVVEPVSLNESEGNSVASAAASGDPSTPPLPMEKVEKLFKRALQDGDSKARKTLAGEIISRLLEEGKPEGIARAARLLRDESVDNSSAYLNRLKSLERGGRSLFDVMEASKLLQAEFRALEQAASFMGANPKSVAPLLERFRSVGDEAILDFAKGGEGLSAEEMVRDARGRVALELLASAESHPNVALRALRWVASDSTLGQNPEIVEKLAGLRIGGVEASRLLEVMQSTARGEKSKLKSTKNVKFMCVIGEMCSPLMQREFNGETAKAGLDGSFSTGSGGSMTYSAGAFRLKPLPEIVETLVRGRHDYIFLVNSSYENTKAYRDTWTALQTPAGRKKLASQLKGYPAEWVKDLARDVEAGDVKVGEFHELWDIIPGRDIPGGRMQFLSDYLLMKELSKGNTLVSRGTEE